MDMGFGVSAITALVMAAAQLLKQVGVPTRWIPLCDLALGLLLAFVYSHIEPMALGEWIFTGLVAGLSACGLYSGVKNLVSS